MVQVESGKRKANAANQDELRAAKEEASQARAQVADLQRKLHSADQTTASMSSGPQAQALQAELANVQRQAAELREANELYRAQQAEHVQAAAAKQKQVGFTVYHFGFIVYGRHLA